MIIMVLLLTITLLLLLLLSLTLTLKTSLALRLGPAGAENLPPGPPRWPVVGNLLQVLLDGRAFVFQIPALRKKYGPIFTMKMGQRTMVVVTGADLIHEATVRRGGAFASRPSDSPIRLLFSSGKCTVNSAAYGALWRALRRNFVSELANPSRVKQYGRIRSNEVENLVDRLRRESDSMGFVEVMRNVRVTMCGILLCICFGAKLSEERVREIESVLKEVILMSTPKIPDFLPVLTPLVFRRQMREAREVRKRQMECLVPLIRARKRFVEAGQCSEDDDDGGVEMVSPIGEAYVDSLLEMEVPERGRLGEDEIVSLCSEVVNGGTDTSATAVEWAMFHVVADQHVQDRLYDELRLYQTGSEIETNIEKMRYLSAVVKETLRRHPPTHFVLSHAVEETTELGGYTIPKGANVEFYTAGVAANPNLWPDPVEFRPERFLGFGGTSNDVDMTGTRAVTMVPFGSGRRICPGMGLGTLHVSLVVASMLRAFKWMQVPGLPPDPTESFAFTVVMKNPLKAVIEARK